MGENSANIALIAVFAALIAALAVMPPVFVVGAVPFAIQIVAVLLAPMVLGAWQGMLANLLYVIAGVAGLPVFAKQASGFGALLGPTSGYVIGYVLSALLVGWLASIVLAKRVSGAWATIGLIGSGMVGVLIIHACGVLGLMVNAKLEFGKAVIATSSFVPFDLLKAVIAALICLVVIKAFPRILNQRGYA